MRKVVEVTIESEDRDKGKTFILTEMPAEQAELWGMKALIALVNAGIDIPDEVRGSGMAGIAVAGAQQLVRLSIGELKPLLDEMFECVKIKVKAAPLGRSLQPEDIEEVQTRLYLRSELIKLHTGFSIADAMGNLKSLRAGKTASAPSSSDTTTSQGQLG